MEHTLRMPVIDACDFSGFCRNERRAEPFPMAWLREIGAKLRKGCRNDITLLADGRARLTVDYQSMSDLLAVLTEIDTIMAMTQEGGVQAASGKRR